MLATHRRDKILELLQEDGSAKVLDLAKLFKVTEVTIRQDLEKLDKDGLIIREHGGAYLKNIKDQVQTFSLTHQEHLDKKERIAAKCLEFIESGDTIILDSGSTTTEVAKKLRGMKSLTVITNALNIALMLGAEPGIEVIVTGGEFKPPTLSLTGQKAADFFKGLHVQKLFLATAGISLKAGLTYPSISDLVVKKAMIEAAETTYLVADSTKIGKAAFASLGALSLIDYIINTHHQYAKTNAVIIHDLAQKVANNHNEKHPELIKLTTAIFLFLHDLLNHMKKEEQILFPNIKQLVKNKSHKERAMYTTFGLIKESVRRMQKAHQAMSKDLKLLHELTNDYKLPEGSCNSYKYLFEKMKEFEADFLVHVYLENNILFPKALAEDEGLDENAFANLNCEK